MFLLYMAAINTDPFTNGSISTIIEDGLAYYIISPGCPLFKATKRSATLDLRRGRLSFFGVYNLDQAYIESYENEYGIIFAFETMRPYKLLALDHPTTKMALYSRVPKNIQDVLRINYGYTMSGKRNSQLNSDLVLSQYLCDNGYQGYATNFIETDIDYFDPEFMICDVGGIKSLGRITDPSRIRSIVESGKLKKHSEELEAARQEKRKNRQRAESPPPVDSASASSIFASYGSPGASYGSPGASYGSPVASYSSPFAPARVVNPFASYGSPVAQSRFAMASSSGIPKFSLGDDMDDDDENKENLSNRKGGLRKRKRRSYKKRKTRTNKRKRTSRTRRRRR